jgi:hypothetical protein
MLHNHPTFREKVAVSLGDLRRTIMSQILDVKSFLMLDHISQDETKRILLHHLVKPSSVHGRKVRGEEKLLSGIPPKKLNPSRQEHPFHRRGVVTRRRLDRFDLLRKVFDLSSKGLDLPQEFWVVRRME